MARIAYLNTYGNGSTGKIVDLLKSLSLENGIDVRSYYSREYCATPETSKRFYSKLGFYHDAFMTRIFDNHGLNSKGNTRRLIKDLEEYKPDIIHIHNLHGYWINYEMLFAYIKKANIKVVFTLHDCWSFTGHCTHFDFVKCEKWKTLCFSCPQKNMYPKGSLFDGSKSNYNKKKKAFLSLDKDNMVIITPSTWLSEKVKESFLNKYNCIVINNGVNIDIFKPTESDLRKRFGLEGKMVILAVASYWDERKGLEYVLECAKAKPDWAFVYVGKEKVALGYSPNNLIHIDRTESQKELAEWYSTADVYFNPTLEDNYPTTNLEAIACGTPVVTFNTGGSPEIVLKTGFGVIVDKDVNSIINGINKAVDEVYSTKKDKLDASLLASNTSFSKYIELYKALIK